MSRLSSDLRNITASWRANKTVKPGVCKWLEVEADRIDAEMAELPRGKDDKPIRVGDTVYGEDGRAWHVRGVTIGEKSIAHPDIIRATSDAEQLRYLKPEWLDHERPDSWERIADELEEWSEDNRVNGDGEVFDRAAEFSERIRRLASREDGR